MLSELAYVPCALVLTWSLFVVRGIPLTHDGLGVVWLEWYRRAYLAGDWFPTWTPFASNGHGSPAPIAYHRLHPQIFGALAIVTGPVLALKISVPLLLVVGAAGLRRLCRMLGARPAIAWIAGVLLMSANYTVVDWFVRGAIAEFTAFMLVPWCIRYALLLFSDARGPWRLAAASVLLFFAHMMTFYYFILVAMVLCLGDLIALRRFGGGRVRQAVARGATFAALMTCAIGPYVAALQYAVAFTPIATFKMRWDDEAYRSWSSCLLDPSFSFWRANLEGAMSAEVGRWMLLALATVLAISAAARRVVFGPLRTLVVLAIVFFVLQPHPMAFVFDLVPGASKIQLPSRLLVFIVPITCLALAVGTERAVRSFAPCVRAIAWATLFVATAGQVHLAIDTQRSIWGSTHDSGRLAGRVERSTLDRAFADPDDSTGHGLAQWETWDLFLPTGLSPLPRTPFLQTEGACTISSSSKRLMLGSDASAAQAPLQCNRVSFTVHGGNCEVGLSQYRSPLLRVRLSGPGAVRTSHDGTTVIRVENDGTTVQIDERSILDLARLWLVEKLSRQT